MGEWSGRLTDIYSRLTAPRGLACGNTVALCRGSCSGVIVGDGVVMIFLLGVEAAEEGVEGLDIVFWLRSLLCL